MMFQYDSECIYMNDESGKRVAEVTFPISGNVADITHTFVDTSLRGQGVAGQLLEAAVQQIRVAGLKIRPSCSYAIHWFAEHPEQTDILVK